MNQIKLIFTRDHRIHNKESKPLYYGGFRASLKTVIYNNNNNNLLAVGVCCQNG